MTHLCPYTPLFRSGLLLAGTDAITSQPLTPDTLRVVVTRMSASVPNCPDFSREGNHEFEGSMISNFGCEVNSNLAAMVARPKDLVRGQPGAPSVDPATATKVIQTDRKCTRLHSVNTVHLVRCLLL